MALDEYRKKRDFKKTTEPEGVHEKSGEGLRFVVQRHQASRLHYDLRLEMNGVLKSWAVPKGPSLNPSDKRLAIETEDHPVKYLIFEGTIPKGNYGAGKMRIWDHGTYTAASEKTDLEKAWRKGSLKILFEGRKLKGEFALVKTNRGEQKNQWLLIKKTDDFSTDLDYDAEDLVEHEDDDEPEEKEQPDARVIDLHDMIKPMLATPTEEVPEKPGWIYEIKWDGYRALANIENGSVHLYSRNGITFNNKFEAIAKALEDVPHDAILDGEIVVFGDSGMPNFQGLQNYSSDQSGELRYYVFDLLFLNGHSLMHLPLTDRKSFLPDVIENIPGVYYCEHVEEDGIQFFEEAVEQGLEGIIAKNKDSTYSPGYRTENWLKIKAVESMEALICGFTKSDKQSHFRSLILGSYKDDELVYIGNCGSGFNEASRKELFEKMKPLQMDENPFSEKVNLKGRRPFWLKPELIAEVKYSEQTKSGSLRHPVFKGLRDDKTAPQIRIKKPKKKLAKASAAPSKKSSASSGSEVVEVSGVKVPFSNLEKVFWPEEGLRKYDLIDYYLKMADVMLPYLKDRPENLHRHPNGISGQSFYHRDTGEIMPHWVQTLKIYSESSDKEIEYLLCQDEPTLLYLAQLGCIEINPWNSRKDSIDFPDYAVIDLDPSEKNTFEEVVEVALATKEVLDMAGIEGYCKTSGSSGLHIYLPLGAEYDYDEARDFTKLLCHYVHQKLPELTTLERSIKKRQGRLYLDFLQNRRGQTLAAPYCLRPKPGATASAPLTWDEVASYPDKNDFNIHTMPDRLHKKGDLFKGVLGKAIDMEKALESLSS